MKAIICTAYGGPEVMQIQEIAKPRPGDHEVLIKIFAATVTSADVRIRKADPFPVRLFYGLFKPKANVILGSDLAGEIEAVGNKVTQFKPGDLVFAGAGITLGANADYLCMAETDAIAIKPNHLTYEEAASIPFGATTSLIFLRDKGKVGPGQKILIYGASGALGTAAVQIGKALGAHVTGVCSTANLDLVKSLGAEAVIDYTKEDFTTTGNTYDLVFDTVGKSSFSGCLKVLKPNGIYLRAVHFDPISILRGLWTSLTGSKKVVGGMAVESQESLISIKELIETGKLRPVIDRCYPMKQVAQAHQYVDQGHKKGNVVLTVAQDSDI